MIGEFSFFVLHQQKQKGTGLDQLQTQEDPPFRPVHPLHAAPVAGKRAGAV